MITAAHALAWVATALLWIVLVAAVLLGVVALVVAILLIPPVSVRGRLDSVHVDEENPLDWSTLSYRLQLSGLLGAARVEIEHDGTSTRGFGAGLEAGSTGSRSRIRIFGWTKSVAGKSPGEDRKTASKPRSVDRRQPQDHRGPVTPGKKPSSTRSSTKRPAPSGRSLSLSQWRRLLPEGVWLIRQAWHKLRLDVQGDLTYGFTDPFVTGIVYGTLVALPRMPRLRLQPDFTRGVLKGWAEFSLRAYPWQIVLLIVRLAFRPGVRSLWWPRLKGALPIPRSTKEVVTS